MSFNNELCFTNANNIFTRIAGVLSFPRSIIAISIAGVHPMFW
jgi:hypothetical protein